MKIEIKQTVWVVVQRWNIDYYDYDVAVFDTLDKAELFAETEAKAIAEHEIEGGEIRHASDGTIIVDYDDGGADWWEATIEKKEVY